LRFGRSGLSAGIVGHIVAGGYADSLISRMQEGSGIWETWNFPDIVPFSD
jgi:hypothetical protein